jgi:hypothetical protein
MAIDPRSFKAPFIDKHQCWNEADKFRERYWPSGAIPVDVLSIAEFDLELEIRPVTRLKEDADIDALLLGDWKTLIVDQQQYMDGRYINRLRYSIAHELGHYVLHKAAYEQIPRGSPDEWISFMRSIPEKEYSFIEYQAYEFAGRLLVPLEQLEIEFEATLKETERNGVNRYKLSEALLAYLCNPVAKCFEVSTDVIEKRLLRENLWPLK